MLPVTIIRKMLIVVLILPAMMLNSRLLSKTDGTYGFLLQIVSFVSAGLLCASSEMDYSASVPVFFILLITVSELRAKVRVELLGEWNVVKSPLTISGYDTGGSMASQMQIAYSKQFRGVAMFASVWYRCAPFGYTYYLAGCGKGANKISNGVSDARSYEKSGKIDPLSYMAYQKVYHWIPVKDELVVPAIRKQTMTFYERVGTPTRNIFLKYQNSFHIMPTANKSDPVCTESQLTTNAFAQDGVGTAYCTYYGVYEALNYLHNNTLTKPSVGKVKLEPVRLFNQSVFLSPSNRIFMDEIGFYYRPSKCNDTSAPCKLHVFLHGCYQSRSRIMSMFVKRSGILEVAEVNNIIMMFPQSVPFPGNDPGCWDVFAATGESYGKFNTLNDEITCHKWLRCDFISYERRDSNVIPCKNAVNSDWKDILAQLQGTPMSCVYITTKITWNSA